MKLLMKLPFDEFRELHVGQANGEENHWESTLMR